jgi:geranylgeranyl pyrophosphate synthase
MSEQFQIWRDLIQQQLDEVLPASSEVPETLHQAMRYSTLSKGKRLRPLLVFAAGQTLGAKIEDLTQLAISVELIHVYSLIHDDLPAMDDDNLRRGVATCHIAFDEATAILAGDALQSLAFERLICCKLSKQAENNRLKMLKSLAKASGTKGMGGGQALDLEATGHSLNLQQLSQLHTMKTGALIRSSVELGALCAGDVDPIHLQGLDQFARLIGLAFQVHDDILDIEGSTEKLGKPQGSDIHGEKATYPALLGLDGAKLEAKRLIAEGLQALQPLPYNTETLQSFARLVIERDH